MGPGLANVGAAYVYSGRDGVILHEKFGDDASGRFGTSVAGPGDVDGDGYADFMVGAVYDVDTGSVSIYSGLTGERLFITYGEAINDNFGQSVSSAGDYNGDGLPDIVVGAPLHDAIDGDEGAAYIYKITTE